MLLEAGAEDEAEENGGWAPLPSASLNGHVEVVKVLLSAGADKDSEVSDSWAPLHSASQEGREKVVKVLLGDRDRQRQSRLRRYCSSSLS